MEQNLLFADERVLKLREDNDNEVFYVVNEKEFKDKPNIQRLIQSGKGMYQGTNEEKKALFEKEIKRCWKVEKVEWESVNHTIPDEGVKCIAQDTLLDDRDESEMENEIAEKELIDNSFILREDLRDLIFKEDNEGIRYRERIWDKIQEFGVEKWFKAKGYPTNAESKWKNRYIGSLTTFGEHINPTGHYKDIESGGYLLWENNLPEALWNDKELKEDYKVGTKEYYARLESENARDKKYKAKPKAQITLFKEKEIEAIEVKLEDLPEWDRERNETEVPTKIVKLSSTGNPIEEKEVSVQTTTNNIIENPIKTAEELQKEKTIEMLDTMTRKLQDECWAIRGYFEKFLNRNAGYRKKNEIPYHIEQMKKYGFENETADLNKLKELFEQKAKMYKLYYEKAHFLRWGTNGEEYSNV